MAQECGGGKVFAELGDVKSLAHEAAFKFGDLNCKQDKKEEAWDERYTALVDEHALVAELQVTRQAGSAGASKGPAVASGHAVYTAKFTVRDACQADSIMDEAVDAGMHGSMCMPSIGRFVFNVVYNDKNKLQTFVDSIKALLPESGVLVVQTTDEADVVASTIPGFGEFCSNPAFHLAHAFGRECEAANAVAPASHQITPLNACAEA